jgi:hypothetical protein
MVDLLHRQILIEITYITDCIDRTLLIASSLALLRRFSFIMISFQATSRLADLDRFLAYTFQKRKNKKRWSECEEWQSTIDIHTRTANILIQDPG